MTTSKAPRGLGTAGRRLWTVVLAEYDLSGPELRVLDLACQAADRSEQARAEIDALGITVTDRYGGPRLHPAVPVERDARAGDDPPPTRREAAASTRRRLCGHDRQWHGRPR